MQKFGEIPHYSWFRVNPNGCLHQKLHNFNGSNAYKLFKGYAHIHPQQPIIPCKQPLFQGEEPDKIHRRLATIQLYDDGTWNYPEEG